MAFRDNLNDDCLNRLRALGNSKLNPDDTYDLALTHLARLFESHHNTTSKMGKYVVNGELTPEALQSTELIKRCTFSVGEPATVRVNDEESGKAKIGPKRQYYQRFVEVAYPNGDKSATVVIPDCVIYHETQNYYGRSSTYVGIPKAFVDQLSLKLSTSGHSPLF